jgi:hypothetical protein
MNIFLTLRRSVTFAFILGLLVVFQGPAARAAHRKAGSFLPMFEVLAAPSVQPILEILDKAKLSGSFVFTGHCDLGACKPAQPIADCFPDFPKLRAAETPVNSAVQTVRGILTDAPAVQVTQDGDGTIRMNEAGVPTDLLNIKISHILFESNGANGQRGVFTANSALRYVLHAPEVLAFMKANDIEGPFDRGTRSGESVPGNAGAWPPDSAHISGSLDNVSLADALDYILKAFPGIWIYENCPQSGKGRRIVYIRFLSLSKIGGRAHVVAD